MSWYEKIKEMSIEEMARLFCGICKEREQAVLEQLTEAGLHITVISAPEEYYEAEFVELLNSEYEEE